MFVVHTCVSVQLVSMLVGLVLIERGFFSFACFVSPLS